LRRLLLAPALLAIVAPGLPAQDRDSLPVREWPTPGERQGWFAPTSPAQGGDYLASLAMAFAAVSIDTLAWIDGGSVQPDSALPVLLATVSRKEPTEGGRLRVLVLAGERGDALTGTEVAIQLVRELAVGEIGSLLESLDVAVVPSVNPWGLLWWIPEEPSGVDPSRDHAGLRSRATRAVHELVRRWRPHLVVELGEIGPSVYRVQAGLPRHPNADPDLARFGRFYLLPYVANELSRGSSTFRELVTVQPEGDELGAPLLGADGLPEGASLTPGPLGLDHATNSFSVGGSLAISLAVASPGGAEGLPDRVQLLYQSVGYLLEVAAAQSAVLLAHEDAAPAAMSIRHEWVQDENHPELVWLTWNERGQIVQQTTDRWRAAIRRELALPVPAGWLIDPSGVEWVDLLLAHGFTVERLRRAARIDVGSYMIGVTAALPSNLSESVPLDSAPSGSALIIPGARDFPAGAWLIRADQPHARLLFTILEPWSQDAPLGREAPGAHDPDRLQTYPVYRVDDEATLDELRTERVAPTAGRE